MASVRSLPPLLIFLCLIVLLIYDVKIEYYSFDGNNKYFTSIIQLLQKSQDERTPMDNQLISGYFTYLPDFYQYSNMDSIAFIQLG